MVDKKEQRIIKALKKGKKYSEIAIAEAVSESTISRINTKISDSTVRRNRKQLLNRKTKEYIKKLVSDNTSDSEICNTLKITQKVLDFVKRHSASKPLYQTDIDRDEVISKNLEHYSLTGYPYPTLTDEKLTNFFNNLTTQTVTEDSATFCRSGAQIINHFHPELFDTPCIGSLSPSDSFKEKEKLTKLLNAVYDEHKEITDTFVRRYSYRSNSSKKISNFPPEMAKFIYQTYKPTQILDFSAGWGGRMLGAMAMDIPYIGLDPSENSVNGNLKILEYYEKVNNKKYNVKLEKVCAEDYLGKGHCKPDLIFTSPPYFNRELYANDATQSCIKFPELQLWYDGFLNPCIKGAYSDLQIGGYLILNIGLEMLTNVLRMGINAGFRVVTCHSLKLGNTNSFKRQLKEEPILVFKKD